MSPAVRRDFQTKYVSTIFSRLSKHARQIIIQTRWAEDDPIGWMLQQQAEGNGQSWEYVNLTGLAPHPDEIPEEEHPLFFPDPLGRQPGEALCPELHPAEQLEMAQRLDPDQFWALFQGRPTSPTGGLFSETWWQFWELGDLLCVQDHTGAWVYPGRQRWERCFQSWDMSFRDTDSSSYVVGGVWGVRGANKYLLDVVRKRMGLEDTIEAVEALKARWPITQEIVIEAKANGPRVIERLRSKIPGLVPHVPEGPKEVRAAAQTYHVRGGNVYLPRPERYAWVRPFIRELAGFPRGRFNDQVDMLVQAMEFLGTHTPFVAPLQKLRPPNPLLRFLHAQ